MITKERAIWVVIVVTIGMAGYFFGKNNQPTEVSSKKTIVEVTSGGADVSNEIDKSFGWAKAPADVSVEVIDVAKGIKKGNDEYDFPTPVVKFAIKNNGEGDIDSFGVDMVVLDELNKRKITEYGQASGEIQRGWTSTRMFFDAMQTDWKEATGNEPISFPVTFIFSAKMDGDDKELCRVHFDPIEFDSLPELDR